MNILILYDEISENPTPDQEDTKQQAMAVYEALMRLGHRCKISQYPMADIWFYNDVFHEWGADLVFNLVESFKGKGQLLYFVTASLDVRKIHYTGNSTEALFMTSNKLIAKKMMKLAGIPTPEWSNKTSYVELGPYLVKSIWEHGSIGVNNQAIIPKDFGPWFAEQYIDGREFNVSLLEIRNDINILPIQETLFNFPPDKLKIVGYDAKWNKDTFEYKHITRSFDHKSEDENLLKKLSGISIECWKLFDLKGYARIDLRVDNGNNPYVIDINANPCLSPDSGFVASAKEAGIDYNQMIQYIIDAAIRG